MAAKSHSNIVAHALLVISLSVLLIKEIILSGFVGIQEINLVSEWPSHHRYVWAVLQATDCESGKGTGQP